MLFDDILLAKLNDKQFNELLARFSVALGDALDPVVQADVLATQHPADALRKLRVVCKCVPPRDAAPRKVFDHGDQHAFDALEIANSKIASTVHGFTHGQSI